MNSMLIVERDPLIADDLHEIALSAMRDRGEVWVADTASEALAELRAKLRQGARLPLSAILHLPHPDRDAALLVRALLRCGASLLLIDPSPLLLAPNVVVPSCASRRIACLDQPYNAAMVLDLLRGFGIGDITDEAS